MAGKPKKDLLAVCADEALKLLHEATTPEGILAAAPSTRSESRSYTSIFGRDACISALAMAHDKTLLPVALSSIKTLALEQAENGQIPNFVRVGKDADFWYLGCIDASLWWLITIAYIDQHTGTKLQEEYKEEIAKTLHWLGCQEHQTLYLLQQNEASDWADIMPRSGFVLYSNALWYMVKLRYELPHLEETKVFFDQLFFPFTADVVEDKRERLLIHYVRNKVPIKDYYLSYVNLGYCGTEMDAFGNMLAVLSGLASDARASSVIRAVRAYEMNEPFPLRALNTPIKPEEWQWREYMGRHKQNYEYQYHNGGIWPFLGGFWALALISKGKPQEAKRELEKMAGALSQNNWEFNEWFHGKTGKPSGMPRQAWNAAMYLLAYNALIGKGPSTLL